MDIPGSRHGACTRAQALTALGRYGLRVAVARGQLVPLWRGVLVDQARLLDPRTRAAAALIIVGPTAVLWGLTALQLHGCSAAATNTVHLINPYNRWARCQPGLQMHQGRLSADNITTVHGMPAAALEIAAGEALCTAPRAQALASVDQAVGAQPAAEQADFIAQVATYLDNRADRRGTRRAAGLLDVIDGAAESPPESSLRLIVVDAGFPVPQAQYEVTDVTGAVRWRLDIAWPQLRIALEYDGYAAHVGRAERDAARNEDLRRRGWLVLHASADDLRNPTRLLDELSGAFRQRGGQLWRRLAAAG